MSDCHECRWARVEGSDSTAGGNEDQTGCDLPLLVEAYTEGEATATLLEGLMITGAESEQGWPWQDREPPAGSEPGILADLTPKERALAIYPGAMLINAHGVEGYGVVHRGEVIASATTARYAWKAAAEELGV